VILINLLPHREEARKRKREAFYASLGLSAVLGVVVAGAFFLSYQSSIGLQQSMNSLLKAESVRLDSQIKDVANLQTEITALRARQQAVEDLQSDRNLPANLLSELAKQLPDGTYLTGLKQEAQGVSMTGIAQSNERVSELLRNISTSEWLSNPELVEIAATSTAVSNKETKKVFGFTLRVQLKKKIVTNQNLPAAAKLSSKDVKGTAVR